MEPVNLKPTNYCTAMWNGIRCDGTHDQQWGYSDVVHSVRDGDCSTMWRDGYGGIVLDERPYIFECNRPDFYFNEGPIESRAISYAGQLAGIGLSGLLETFETLVDSDWSSWLGAIDTGVYTVNEIRALEGMPPIDPQWEMSTGSFTQS